ncbi:hypothetical protein D9619_002699 [Psilocybe cf. subviscida]|uniref:Uncharacterized protein n=1 Tax=Psilocybe cf. subviscida TaxID=2480587 RepID=A0A8H5EUD5_9AGAR|nr:hypothetical protein D9619_002699 [Psilocybe cf. subviscida]
MPLQLHRPPPQHRSIPTRSHSGSDATTTTAPLDDPNASVYSFFSSSDHTALSLDQHKDLPSPPKYSHDLERDFPSASATAKLAGEYGYSLKKGKSDSQLPSWAQSQAMSRGGYGSPYQQPYAQSRIALTTSEDLAAALGLDNTPHSTEIDVLPCAGVRIPYGSLTGQLAWRMVVHAPLRSKDKHWLFSSGSEFLVQEEPCNCFKCKRKRQEDPSNMSGCELSRSRWSAHHRPGLNTLNSSISLPLDTAPSSAPSTNTRVTQPQPRTAHHPLLPRVVANFILDSSLPHSVISRETLIALGVREASLPSSTYDPHGEHADDDERRGEDVVDTRTQLVFHIGKGKHHGPDRKGVVTGVTLSIQGVKTRVRVGRIGEASRLGVEFLKDAGASLMFPGDGVGPVLYLESMGAVHDAPRTVLGLSRWKNLTLPQRVKLILGIAPSS